MEALTCRLLPYAEADGATNMAADEVLVHAAAERGQAAMRCYGWTSATLSLGYFQPAAVRGDPRLAALPWVRRPSGGAALVHHHELTYALALPPGVAWRSPEPWLERMHRIIAQALSTLGLAGQLEVMTGAPRQQGDVLCFQKHTPGDLLCDARKVVGSAQRKVHQALLQHGSVLLAGSEHTPELPGICELTGVAVTVPELCAALRGAFGADTRWELEPAAWSAEEEQATVLLGKEKYASVAWNERR